MDEQLLKWGEWVRQQVGNSKRRFAEKTGTDRRQVRRWCRIGHVDGAKELPELETLQRIAEKLECTVEELLRGVPQLDLSHRKTREAQQREHQARALADFVALDIQRTTEPENQTRKAVALVQSLRERRTEASWTGDDGCRTTSTVFLGDLWGPIRYLQEALEREWRREGSMVRDVNDQARYTLRDDDSTGFVP